MQKADRSGHLAVGFVRVDPASCRQARPPAKAPLIQEGPARKRRGWLPGVDHLGVVTWSREILCSLVVPEFSALKGGPMREVYDVGPGLSPEFRPQGRPYEFRSLRCTALFDSLVLNKQ